LDASGEPLRSSDLAPEELQTEGFGEARKPSTRKRPKETTKDFIIPRTINNNLHLSQNQEMTGSQAFTR